MFRRIGADVYAATSGRQSPELSISMAPEYYLNQSKTDQTIWARIPTKADAGGIGSAVHGARMNAAVAAAALARLARTSSSQSGRISGTEERSSSV